MKFIATLIVLVGCISFANAQDYKENEYVKERNLIRATLFYEDGAVSQKGYYTKDGKLQGDWVSFDKAGNKTAEAYYENGVKTGKWFFWQDNNILKEVDYTNSKITAVNTWKIQGERMVSVD